MWPSIAINWNEIFLFDYDSLDLTSLDSRIFNPDSWKDLTPAEIRSDFIAYNNLPMGMMHHGDRLFITLPRRRTGMPATITYIRTNLPRSSSPGLQAYPNFRMNQLPVSLWWICSRIRWHFHLLNLVISCFSYADWTEARLKSNNIGVSFACWWVQPFVVRRHRPIRVYRQSDSSAAAIDLDHRFRDGSSD